MEPAHAQPVLGPVLNDTITPPEEPLTIGKWRDRVQRLSRPFRILGLVLVIGFCAWKLNQIGWGETIRKLPLNPIFYLLFAASFAVVPLAEQWIFRILWGARIPWAPLYRKRALNSMVLGYSGDVYFYVWCTARLGLPHRQLLSGVKDSSLLSAIAGTITTVMLVVGLLFAGQHGLLKQMAGAQTQLGFVIVVVGILTIPLFILFRRSVFGVSGRDALKIFAIHTVRSWLGLLFQLVQWWVVLPAVPMGTWWLLITAQALINQLPLVPNGELIVLALSLQLAHQVGVDPNAFIGLMVGTALVRQLANIASLLGTSFARDPKKA